MTVGNNFTLILKDFGDKIGYTLIQRPTPFILDTK